MKTPDVTREIFNRRLVALGATVSVGDPGRGVPAGVGYGYRLVVVDGEPAFVRFGTGWVDLWDAGRGRAERLPMAKRACGWRQLEAIRVRIVNRAAIEAARNKQLVEEARRAIEAKAAKERKQREEAAAAAAAQAEFDQLKTETGLLAEGRLNFRVFEGDSRASVRLDLMVTLDEARRLINALTAAGFVRPRFRSPPPHT